MSVVEMNGELMLLKDIDKLLSHTQYTGNNNLFMAYPVIYHTVFYNLVKNMRLSHNLEELLFYRLHELQADLPDEIKFDHPTLLDLQQFMPAKYNHTSTDLDYRFEH
jgi:hypothetical protein